MKLQAALVAASVAIFAAGDAAAYIWLQDTATDNFNAYCKRGGAKVNSKYGCFIAYPGFFGEIGEDSDFQGYQSHDGKAFVLVSKPNLKPAIIRTASWGDTAL
ncbi:uncharacterized protein UTRI_10020 [Ustilago trichophora]|uniref:Uncharacterized protein n=1 Tax=Ustilago trichophora TaxID=86804 RepID=A0A5C3DRB3_9BASI|nr:uncharacterized protein UTRI_10020 [Ustilago trichophora]